MLIEVQDAIGDGVAVMMIVKEPAIEVLVADCRLKSFQIHALYGVIVQPPPVRTHMPGTKGIRNAYVLVVTEKRRRYVHSSNEVTQCGLRLRPEVSGAGMSGSVGIHWVVE